MNNRYMSNNIERNATWRAVSYTHLDQYCFKTEAAIECLKFVKGEKIWLK